MEVSTLDRRQRRSPQRGQALHYQLAQVAEDFCLDVFVIADEIGDLIATSTRSDAGTQVSLAFASFSPMLVESRSNECRGLALDAVFKHLADAGVFWEREEVVVREFHVGARRFLLTAVGEPGTERELGVYRAILGVRRIWRQVGVPLCSSFN